MKVLFKKDVQGVAKAGEVKDVSDGHARNFLIPRGLAVPATAATLNQVEAQKKAAARRAAEEEQAARELKAKLEAEPIVLEAKSGAQGRLYGSVTSADVVDAVQKQLGAQLEKRDVEISDTIRTVGTHNATARLHKAVTANLRIDVRAIAGN